MLTPEEDTRVAMRFDIGLLSRRLSDALAWLRRQPSTRAPPLGLFGASTGAAAALAVAARNPDAIAAVVSRGGRPDLAPPGLLDAVRTPTLLIVGGDDTEVLALNRDARRYAARGARVAGRRAVHRRSRRATAPRGAELPGRLRAPSTVAAIAGCTVFQSPGADPRGGSAGVSLGARMGRRLDRAGHRAADRRARILPGIPCLQRDRGAAAPGDDPGPGLARRPPAGVPASAVVPGDVVELSAGALVPADGCVIESRECHVSQAENMQAMHGMGGMGGMGGMHSGMGMGANGAGGPGTACTAQRMAMMEMMIESMADRMGPPTR